MAKGKGRPTRAAIVKAGSTVYLKRGLAYAGAKVRPDDLPGGNNEHQKLLKLGILIRPKTEKDLKPAGAQLGFSDMNEGSEESEESEGSEGSEGSEESEESEGSEGAEGSEESEGSEGAKVESSKKKSFGGAERKK